MNGVTIAGIAETLLGKIEWYGPDQGYCRCPGQHLHSGPDGNRDCRITVDGAPTIFCLHTSCRLEIERVNHQLRSALGKAKFNAGYVAPKSWRPTAEERKRNQEREAYQRLKLRAVNSLAQILEKFATDPAELFEESPVRLLDDPTDDWRLLLGLFPADDVLWIGDKYDSGKGHERNFRTVSDWLSEQSPPAQFVCPNTFKIGSFSRSNESVKHTRFLVVESDTLSKNEIAAVFSWSRQFLRLRAVIDTAGKSLHGWFDYPSSVQLHELKGILPELDCDPALFKPSQPVRLPGARRGDKTQALLYLDLHELTL